MFTSTTTLIALVAITVRVAYAAPPACLLAAVNTTPDPSDFKSICASPDTVTSYISKNCGNSQQTALSAFEDLCKNAGQTVVISSSTSSSAPSTESSTDSESGSSGSVTTGTSNESSATASASSTGPASGFAGPSVTGSTTSASSSSTTSTGGAARLGMDVVGLLAVGVMGMVMM